MPTESFAAMAETPSGKIPSREEIETRLREGTAAVVKIFR
jgi:hypothetical protein